MTSRWRCGGLRAASIGKKELTDAEWEQYLQQSVDIDAKILCKQYEAKLAPIKDAMSSQRLRQQMASDLKFQKKKAGKNEICLISGDRVVCQTSQYPSTAAGLKFQNEDSKPCVYRIVNIDGGIVEVEEISSGRRMFRHEATLKLMPKVMSY